MSKSYLCQYGCCQKDGDLPVLLTYRRAKDDQERVRFCSLEHAALWSLKHGKKLPLSKLDELEEMFP
jgi:hypothetical protein